MAPRSSWKGFIRLSLVSVPVRAFTANNTSEEIRLNQLHADCNSRVRYKKVCPEHGELRSEDIVSGYEYTKDNYVIVEQEELNKIRKQSDRAINIDGFVSADDIDSIFYAGKTYYLLPDGVAGDRPYALLSKGMEENGVVAVAQIVLSGREQLVMLRPKDGLLLMTVLHYAKKVKAAEEFKDELKDQQTSKEELQLTETLIKASTIQDFDLSKYEDEYVKNLSKLIQMKVDGQEIVQAPDLEEPKIINLMDALKKSVAQAQAGAGKKKMAPSETRKKASDKRKSG